MIDWVSFNLPYEGPPVASLHYRGETGQHYLEQGRAVPLSVEGSYSSKMSVQTIGGRMYISGNPVKFFTGQNVCGTNDLAFLVESSFDYMIAKMGLPDCIRARRAIKLGFVELTRVDCTFSYRIGKNAEDVNEWLRAMENSCHVRFRGRGNFDPGMCTLMYGVNLNEAGKVKASRRSTFKFYNKEIELNAHPPTCSNENSLYISELVRGTVRGEALFRGIELKKLKKHRLAQWRDDTAYDLHRSWIDKMEVSNNMQVRDDLEHELPQNLRSTYHLWRCGLDVQSMVSRATFYRHRKSLMEHDIDIGLPRMEAPKQVEVVPVIRVLEAVPVCEVQQQAKFYEMMAAA